VLAIAASIETLSEHPLAAAVIEEAKRRGVEVPDVTAFQALPGLGLTGQVGGEQMWVGNEALLARVGRPVGDAARKAAEALIARGRTVMYVADHDVRGVIAVADRVRPEARGAIRALHEAGILTVMLTGDRAAAGKAVARALGIDTVYAELLPEDKLACIRSLQKTHGRVAMVGDGVNDAPALAVADVGVAMGAAGSDVAMETADVVLVSDDLSRVPFLLALSRRARRAIAQNLAVSLTVIGVLIASAAIGILNLVVGVVGHEGSTVVVVLNGLRLLGVAPRAAALPEPAGGVPQPTPTGL
jgi:Cd2+/Zn2+-exporting ATPase